MERGRRTRAARESRPSPPPRLTLWFLEPLGPAYGIRRYRGTRQRSVPSANRLRWQSRKRSLCWTRFACSIRVSTVAFVRIWRIVRKPESGKFFRVNTRQHFESHPLRHPSPIARFARGFGWQAARANRSLRSRLRMAGRACASVLRRMPTAASERSERSWRRWASQFLRTRLAKEDNSPPRCRAEIANRAANQPEIRALFVETAGGASFAIQRSVPYPAKRFVYIIRSSNHPQRRYVGATSDLHARLNAHNAGMNRSTAPWTPWLLDVTIEFRTEQTALRFEKYLKSGAGHAFASRHFVSD